MNRTVNRMILVAIAAIIVSSCTRGERFAPIIDNSHQIQTIFNISVSKNTKSRTKTKADVDVDSKADGDSKTSYDVEKNHSGIDADIAFGIVGVDSELDVVFDNQPVFEKEGVRMADLVTYNCTDDSMSVQAYYPYVGNVSYHKDGSYAISFTPNDIKKGPLASNAVEMRCDQDFETVSLNFHHISNSIGFKVCDITEDEQLQRLMHIRKVVLHGMPTEGMFVVDGADSHWVPNAKRNTIVIYEGDDFVEYGEDNALYLTQNNLSSSTHECNRVYVVPEELKEGKHFVEVVFDVDSFDYDGTHYRGVTKQSQTIPLSGIIPDDFFELGLQYTFTLGMNLGTVYRPIEFSATVDEWEIRFNGRVLDYDNE